MYISKKPYIAPKAWMGEWLNGWMGETWIDPKAWMGELMKDWMAEFSRRTWMMNNLPSKPMSLD